MENMLQSSHTIRPTVENYPTLANPSQINLAMGPLPCTGYIVLLTASFVFMALHFCLPSVVSATS